MSVVVTGDEVGLVKVWGCHKASSTPQLFQWGIQGRSRAVAGLCFADEARRKEVLVAQADGNLTKLQLLKSGGLHSSNVARNLTPPITGGLFVDWTAGTPWLLSCHEAGVDLRDLSDPDHRHAYELPGPIDACAYQGGRLAFGGRENDLKLWNVERHKVTFRARNVPLDFLDMRVPVYVSAVCYMWPDRQDLLAVATGYHQLRLYDTRANCRPVTEIKFQEAEARKTTIARHPTFFEHEVFVGDVIGQIFSVDVRKVSERAKTTTGRMRPAHAGSVRALIPHPMQPCIASSGLGRKMYIHDLKSKQLVAKAYLKQKCTALVFSSAPAFVDHYQVGVDGKVYDDVWEFLDHVKRRKAPPAETPEASASPAPDGEDTTEPSAADPLSESPDPPTPTPTPGRRRKRRPRPSDDASVTPAAGDPPGKRQRAARRAPVPSSA